MEQALERMSDNYWDTDLPYGAGDGRPSPYMDRRMADLNYFIEIERIKQQVEEAHIQRELWKEARKLDLKERSQNRACEITVNVNGALIFGKEMLQEEAMKRPIANFSNCKATLFEPSVASESDRMMSLLSITFYNIETRSNDWLLMDVTKPDAHVLVKMMERKGVKFRYGKKWMTEHRDQLLACLIGAATTIKLPRNRGFEYVKQGDQVTLRYIGENELTWIKMEEEAYQQWKKVL
ncbi:MAG TPA: hypothetical protein H9716_06065 [Candidatus Enterocloster faecavium]|uniref:Uncharacterized protein n=1 Tax=Candidatus Enterocloster faecavium TaxID=2838560 RepID=A0A9D2RL26_9FIRM|nr:hypothetical protein [Candidatus Enterocloster faecavium]